MHPACISRPHPASDCHKATGSTQHAITTHVATHAQIYNESIFDLLAAPSSQQQQQRGRPPALRLKEHRGGVISVQGMAEVRVGCAAEALELLRRANRARQCAGTGVNERSSRSHAVITVRRGRANGWARAVWPRACCKHMPCMHAAKPAA